MLKKAIVPAICVLVVFGVVALAYMYIGGGFVAKPQNDRPVPEKPDDSGKPADKHEPKLQPLKHSPSNGVFGIVKLDEQIQPPVVAEPKVKGMSLAFRWDKINPAEGRYNWSELDSEIDHCRRFRKEIILTVLPGYYTPKWVLDKGVKLFQFKNVYRYDQDTKDKMVSIPVPWDETYMKEWEKFIAELGRHCAGRHEIAMLHMAGPTAFTERVSLPSGKDDMKNWQDTGYSKDKILFAWAKTFESYVAAFPDTVLCLTLDLPVIGADEKVLEEIVNIGAKRLKGRFAVQSPNLQDNKLYDNFKPRPEFSILARHKNDLIIGLQQGNVGYEFAPKPGMVLGSLKNAVEFGMQFSPAYFELYSTDIIKTPEAVEIVNKHFAGK